MSKNRELAKAVGDQAAHDSPAGNANVVYLDRLWEALDVQDTTAMSAVGRGAIVESGSNSNGHYVRWENGEQVCFHKKAIDHTGDFSGSSRLTAQWAFPAGFSGAGQSVQMALPVHASANFIGCSRTDVISWGPSGSDSPSAQSLSIFFTGGVSTTDARVEDVQLSAWGFWK